MYRSGKTFDNNSLDLPNITTGLTGWNYACMLIRFSEDQNARSLVLPVAMNVNSIQFNSIQFKNYI